MSALQPLSGVKQTLGKEEAAVSSEQIGDGLTVLMMLSISVSLNILRSKDFRGRIWKLDRCTP